MAQITKIIEDEAKKVFKEIATTACTRPVQNLKPWNLPLHCWAHVTGAHSPLLVSLILFDLFVIIRKTNLEQWRYACLLFWALETVFWLLYDPRQF
jgi:hypothetical protein